jgi:hypothetical protein
LVIGLPVNHILSTPSLASPYGRVFDEFGDPMQNVEQGKVHIACDSLRQYRLHFLCSDRNFSHCGDKLPPFHVFIRLLSDTISLFARDANRFS